MDNTMSIKAFKGYRPPPEEYVEKGITNAGASVDYEGVIFSDGSVVILSTGRS